ncbi:MAG TPA: ABC transporter ATP-binding protein [Gammaproteobacteria bacterium]|jgi:branched-chain amino acid transport system ATP-binding protein|nr:MAG: ABC transporter ATP-binding protein [Proteobacteria bacterium TMED51]HAU40538.1 ABC transporter ATP-binding protein [Gammaproteobacteria bacterium]HBP84755.1 ABC transporter ATP-binding protein [Gammaproteobacteria bacterium]HCL95261.1 ABC transporter ATP-binding protein [Gammaproteobacteria bacterium]|tara:strand:- start:196 stop:897 length:702 start_codon:yes stop_codon:yes gene_type:complete
MLEVRNLSAFYGHSQALFDVNLSVGKGQLVSLLGRNGMGKTTTVNCIMGLLASARGVIEFDRASLVGLPSYRVAQSGIGIVPEGRSIFPNLTVEEQLRAFAGERDVGSKTWKISEVYELFPNLAKRQSSFGNQLSGGEQQMLAIGRALMTNPVLLILDEATEGLAPLVRQEIWRCLKQLKHEGLSILVIDKNVSDIARIADQHFIVEKGRTVWSGSSMELESDRSISTRYLGL